MTPAFHFWLPGDWIAGYWFSGPVYLGAESEWFRGWNGVYVVASISPWGVTWLDVGLSDDIARRIRWHDRKPDWFRWATGPIIVFARPEPGPFSRYLTEQFLRSMLNPVSGDR